MSDVLNNLDEQQAVTDNVGSEGEIDTKGGQESTVEGTVVEVPKDEKEAEANLEEVSKHLGEWEKYFKIFEAKKPIEARRSELKYDAMGESIEVVADYTPGVDKEVKEVTEVGGKVYDYRFEIPFEWGVGIVTTKHTAGEGMWFNWWQHVFMANEEYDKLEEDYHAAMKVTRPVVINRDPIVIDLNNDGVKLSQDLVSFDLDNDGKQEIVSWISNQDGILVRDVNKDGTIDNGSEFFSENTVLKDGSIAKDGYTALKDLDSNSDNLITSDDENYSELKVWKDANGDGISQADELYSLEELNIKEIRLEANNVDKELFNGSVKVIQGTSNMGDVEVETAQLDLRGNTNIFITKGKVSDEVLELPEAMGMGKMDSLRYCMENDIGLYNLVKKYVAAKNEKTRDNLLDEILIRWTNAKDVNKVNGRSSTLIAIEKVVILEQAMGKPYTGLLDYAPATQILERSYDNLKIIVSSQLMLQTVLKDIFEVQPIVILKDETGKVTGEYVDYIKIASLLNEKIENGYDRSILKSFRECALAMDIYDETTIANVLQSVAVLTDDMSIREYAEMWSVDNLTDGVINIAAGGSATANDDVILGTDLDETINGGNGADTIYGDVGNDTLRGGNGNDVIYGGEGSDTLYGDAGHDILDGGKRDDLLDGGAGDDTYVFGKGYGNDRINNYSSTASDVDELLFRDVTFDEVKFTAQGNNLVITILETEESVTIENYFNGGNYVVEKITFADEKAITYKEVMSMPILVEGTDESETIQITAATGNIHIHGKEGNDILTGAAGNDTIYGEEGNDTLKGAAGNDKLYGGEDDDKLYGEAGEDYLDGGSGEDYLDGGAGNDTYIYGKGYGNDQINNYSSAATDIDKLILKDLNLKDVAFEGTTNNDLVIRVVETGETLTIVGYFNEATYSLEKIQFADGKVLTPTDIKALDITVMGTEESDNMSVAIGGNKINVYGNKGDDVIKATTKGNYNIYGGEGSDTVQGGSSADMIYGEAGNDTLKGGAGNDVLEGGAGNDSLYGEAGNDILDGGAGEDLLDGGAGDDIYYFAKGYGNDRINNYSSAANDIDEIVFKELNYDDVKFGVEGNHLVLTIIETEESITVENYFSGGTYAVEKINFADGKSVTYTEVLAMEVIAEGTSKPDTIQLVPTNANIHVYGRDGNDNLTGVGGNDTFYGEAGNDTIHGGAGNDILYGGEDDDSLYGEAGEDYLDGGTGNDYLDGGVGNDTYVYGKGYGNDKISNYGSAAGDVDKLILKGLKLKDVSFEGTTGNDLIIRILETNETLTIAGYFHDASYSLEKIYFEDGKVLTPADVRSLDINVNGTDETDAMSVAIGGQKINVYGNKGDDSITATTAGNYNIYGGEGHDTVQGGSAADKIYGEAGNDILKGGAGNDVIEGGEGNDTIYGEAGNDILDGGAGEDILDGGAGDDTYYFAKGYGNDHINNYKSAANDIDELILKGLKYEDVQFTAQGNHLVLVITETGETLTIDNYFSGGTYSLEKITFADGKVVTYEDVMGIAVTVEGTEFGETIQVVPTTANINVYGKGGNDTLLGNAGNDVLNGGNGNDTLKGNSGNDILNGDEGNDMLYGEGGDDILNGGAGNDYLDGGTGDDIYYFEKGYGNDRINNYSSGANDVDELIMKDIKFEDVKFTAEGNNLIISVIKTGESITIENYFSGGSYALEKITFADKKVLSYQDVTNMPVFVEGTEIADVISLTATTGNIQLYGKDGNDTLNGAGGNDTIYGDAGNDIINGGAGHDKLYGGDDDDKLYGEGGEDYLDGGSGNDYLDGGAGNDTYIYAKGYGNDSISNYSSAANDVDKLVLKGLKLEDVKFEGNTNNDLIIRILETNETLTVLGYFNDASYALEKIYFEDKVLSPSDVRQLDIDVTGTDEIDNMPVAIGGSKINIYGNNGDDTITAKSAGNYNIYAGEGSDTVQGGSSADKIYGEEGNDTLKGGAGNDLLEGGEGNDSLYGEAGNDILKGGAGDDYLDGGVGDDIYYFAKGYGNDRINNYYSGATDIDELRFEGVKAKDVTFGVTGNHLVITILETGESMTIENYFSGGTYSLERITFADGKVFKYEDVTSMPVIVEGTKKADTISLTASTGNIYLYGKEGNDTLVGGAGNDTIYGDEGSDKISAGAGNDTIYGGDDDDTIYGEAGEDYLDGGAGNDYLDGGAGNDTYVFTKGYGNDTISNYGSAATDIDKLELKYLTIDQVKFEGTTTNDLIIRIIETNETIKIAGYFHDASYSLEKICFADGTVLTPADVRALDINVNGTDEVDSMAVAIGGQKINVYGNKGDDTITATSAGNYNIYAGEGSDTVQGNIAADHIYGEDGNDTLKGGAGNDVLDGGAGNDSLYGEAGNDILRGDMGDDYLDGGVGDDIYYFAKGYGNDRINNYYSAATDIDELRFEGIKYDQVKFAVSGNHLVISIIETGESMTVENYFSGGTYALERITFADGKVLTYQDVINMPVVVEGTDDVDNISVAATTGNVHVYGKAGNDTLTGAAGNDTLYGEEGNDIISGGAGNDTLYGGMDDDSLYGGAGEDYLDGGTGTDYLEGGAGNDTYVYGKGYGNDKINNYGSVAADIDKLILKDLNLKDVRFEGTTSNDLIIRILATNEKLTIAGYFNDGVYSLEKIYFADETVLTPADVRAMDIRVEGTDEVDSMAVAIGGQKINVYGNNGDDTITATSAGNYNIYGGAGSDTIQGNAATDNIYGEDGNDTLKGGAGNDTLDGGAGNDSLYGEAGNDILKGGSGNDYLDGGIGDDVYVFAKGYGNDRINNYTSGANDIDELRFEGIKYRDVKFAAVGNNLVISLTETGESITVENYFAGGNYALERITFADNKVLSYQDVINMPVVVEGTDTVDSITLTATTGNINVYGKAGNDTLAGAGGNDTLYGDEGNDIISGGAGNDKLYGGADDDSLYGEAGEDYLDGGIGKDYLDGGAGNDTYVYSKGYGNDTINNYSSAAADVDTLILKGLRLQDVKLEGNTNNDLIIRVRATNETLTISNYFSGGRYELEKIYFSDNVVLTPESIRELDIAVTGTEEADNMSVAIGSKSITVYGDKGDDTIKAASAGNYNIYAGEGSDMVQGGASADKIYGEDGNDTLSGGAGNDAIEGGAGNDSLYGETGNDILDGGAGNDYLDGGVGDDTYIFAKGYGDDRINNYKSGTNDIDKLILKDITPDEAKFEKSGTNLVITIIETKETLTIEGYYSGGTYVLDLISFADGTTMNFKDIAVIAGTDKDDTIELENDAKYQYVYAGAGNDTAIGTQEGDYINGGLGNDTLQGKGGNDTLIGEAGDDVLDGGKGNDYLEGGAGNDTYIFARGYGNDRIYNGSSKNSDKDKLMMKGISYADVQFEATGSNLVIRVLDTEETVTLIDYFKGENNIVDTICFESGEELTYDDISEIELIAEGTEKNDIIDISTSNDTFIYGYGGNDRIIGGHGKDEIYGGVGDDIIYGNTGNDKIYGESGNDRLVGGSGTDYLDGGKGDDYLEGGYGNDTYVYAKGYGNDEINNNSARINDRDQLIMKNISYDEVLFEAKEDSLVIRVAETDETVTISNYFNGGAAALKKICFSDGTELTFEDIASMDFVMEGTSDNDKIEVTNDNVQVTIYGQNGDDIISSAGGDDKLYGGAGNDKLSGGAGNDKLYGGIGDDALYGGMGADYLDGGNGDDYLEGGIGNDTYIYAKGYGNDHINNTSSGKYDKDVLNLKDLRLEDVQLEASQTDLVIRVFDTDETLTVEDYFSGNNSMIENIKFADNTVLTYEDVLNHEVVIEGSSQADQIEIIPDNANIYAYGYAGDDIIYGGAGNDTIYGGVGNDKLYGAIGNDNLYGGAGDDKIDGGEGNDTLHGGRGNDYLEGGEGADTYIFVKGDGQDVIYDKDGCTTNKDSISLGDNALNMMFSKEEDGLVISNMTNDDQITIKDWSKGAEYQIEEIKSKDGMTLTNTAVDALIDAMASFETEKGMSWNECVDQDKESTSALISQFWVSAK